MKTYPSRILWCLLSFSGSLLLAQPDDDQDLGQLELNVVDGFQAEVMEAGKRNELPDYEDSLQAPLQVDYKITSEPIAFRFQPDPISPARISRVRVGDLYQGLARLGYGLYNTPSAEIYWNSRRSSKQAYGIYGKHFSTQQGVEDIIYEDNSLAQNALGGFYNRFYRKFTLQTALSGSWNKYSYYGTPAPSSQAADADTLEAPYNWYRHYQVDASLIESESQYLGPLKRLDFNYDHLNDNYNSQENDLRLGSSWLLPAEDRPLEVDVNLSWFGLRHDSLFRGADSSQLYDSQTFQAHLYPHVSYLSGDFLFDFGLDLYWQHQADSRSAEAENPVYFFPEITVAYPLVQDVLEAEAGITGELRRNTYRELTAETPYLLPGMDHLPSRELKLYAGLNGKLSSATSFSLEGGYRQTKGRALLFRQPDFYSDSARYGLSLRYGQVNSFYAQGEISTNLYDNLRLSLQARLRSLSRADSGLAYHIPWFRSKLSADYTIADKIQLGTTAQWIGPRQAFDQKSNLALPAMLEGFLQLDLSVKYIYNKRISAFIRAHNVLNQSYQLYLGYPNQQINFRMGFGYRF